MRTAFALSVALSVALPVPSQSEFSILLFQAGASATVSSMGGPFVLQGSAGETVAGTAGGEQITVLSGFWPGVQPKLTLAKITHALLGLAPAAPDANSDGKLDSADAVHVINLGP